MKNLFILCLLCFCTLANAQLIESTPFDFTAQQTQKIRNFNLSSDWTCSGNNCPQVYKAKGLSLFSLYGTTYAKIQVEIPGSAKKEIKKDKKLMGFIENSVVKIYHIDKGFIKEVAGIRVLAGDK